MVCWDSRKFDIYFQETIERVFRELCGIGMSNSSCACASGLACLGISLFRDRFQDPADQESFENILLLAKEKHAWQIKSVSRGEMLFTGDQGVE